MSRSFLRAAGALQVGTALTVSAFGQALVEPADIAPLRQLYAAAPSAAPLRCDISAVRPALNYAFRFRTGYTADIPLAQFRGVGHTLTIHTRVTPDGHEPVYLTKTEGLPQVPDTTLAATTGGAFLVGEGAYRVEVLLEDDQHRVCRNGWQIQARRWGSERQLYSSIAPGAVEEISATDTRTPEAKPGPRIARLTILLHAAPLVPNLSSLQPDDIERLTDSLASLLRELPAQTVRLIAFNLDQRAIVFREDAFEVRQIGDLTTALNHLELGLADYRVLRERPEPMDLLVGLVQAELQDPKPPDALILMGPRTRMRDDVPAAALGKRPATGPPVYDLQYGFNRIMRAGRGMYPAESVSGALSHPGMPPAADGSLPDPVLPAMAPDTIERLVTRLKGQTLPVRTPHDLADAIQRMDSKISRTAPAASEAAAHAPVPKAAPLPVAAPASPAARPTEPTADDDPVDVLMRLRDQVVAHGARIPNHTCVESIQRDRYEPKSGRAPQSCDTLLGKRKQGDSQARLKAVSTDWLHLDVAMAATGEIYSWAGASKFEEGEIDELVPEGAMGTGPYASMILSILGYRGPKYIFEGETVVAGRRLFEYSFAVPLPESRYRVKAHKEWVFTGYSGTLLIDPKTAELVRLSVRTDELPPATETCECDTSLEYGIVQLGGGDYLLPKIARQRFIGRDGSESENIVSFSACREYHAESKLAFGEGAQTDSKQVDSSVAALDFPAGLPVTVELMTTVGIGKSAAGDTIRGRLAKPVRDKDQKTLVPEGATVQGRLMRVETDYSPRREHTVALRWETVEIGGVMTSFSLLPSRRPADMITGVGNVLRRRGMEIELPLPSEGKYGVYHLPAERTSLEPGFRTEWLSAKP